MNTSRCTDCGRTVPSWEGVYRSDGRGGSSPFFCGRCWARVLSEETGEEIGHIEMEPVVMPDAYGRMHEFHFRFNPLPRGIEAFELVDGFPGGYKFQVLQKGDDPAIVGRLLEKMHRALRRRLAARVLGWPRTGMKACNLRVLASDYRLRASNSRRLRRAVLRGLAVPAPDHGPLGRPVTAARLAPA